MMKKLPRLFQTKLVPIIIGLAVLNFAAALFADDKSAPRISKEVLQALLDTPAVVVIDVRLSKDWDASEYKIKNAVRQDLSDLSWAKNYSKGTILVLYCA